MRTTGRDDLRMQSKVANFGHSRPSRPMQVRRRQWQWQGRRRLSVDAWRTPALEGSL